MTKPTPKPPSPEKQALAHIARVIKLDESILTTLEEIAGYLKRIAQKVDPQ